MIFRSRAPLLALCLALVSCASGPEGPVDPGSAASSSARIGPAGGSVQVDGTDGARLVLEVPPGAALEFVDVFVRATDDPTTFEVGPAGHRFHRELVLRISAPESVAPRAVSFTYAGRRVSTEATHDGTDWVARSYYLGFPSPSVARRAEGAAVTTLDLSEVDCSLVQQDLLLRFEVAKSWFAAGGHATIVGEQLSALIAQLKLAKASCGDAIDVSALQDELGQIACEAYDDAITNANVVLAPETPEELESTLTPILMAEAAKQETDATCGPSVEDALEGPFDAYLDLLTARVSSPSWAEDVPWDTSWAELIVVAHRLWATSALFGLEGPEQRITEHVLPTMVARLHQGAFRICEEDNDQSYLVDVMSAGALRGHVLVAGGVLPGWAGVSTEAVTRDVAYCANELQVDVFDATVDQIASVQLGSGGVPGEELAAVPLGVPFDGFLDLTGPLRSFLCFDPSGGATAFGDEVLVIRANGQTLGELLPSADGAFLTTPFDVSIAQVLQLLGLPEDEEGVEIELTITREGSACSGLYGESDFELFRLDLLTEDACAGGLDRRACEGVLVVSIDFPATITEDGAHALEVTTSYVEAEGSEVVAPGIDIAVSVVGGTVVASSGVTDEDGDFSTFVQLDSGSDHILVSVTATDDTGQEAVQTVEAGLGGGIVLLEDFDWVVVASASALASGGEGDTDHTDTLLAGSMSAEAEDAFSQDTETGSISLHADASTALEWFMASENDRLTSITASGTSTASVSGTYSGESDGTYAEIRSSASGRASVRVEVTGAAVSMHIVASASGSDISIEVDSEDGELYDQKAFEHDVILALEPGRYELDLSSGVSARDAINGTEDSASDAQSGSFSLTVTLE